MKKFSRFDIKRTLVVFILLAILVFSFSGCSLVKGDKLASPDNAHAFTRREKLDENFSKSVENFASNLTYATYKKFGGDNFTISPVSVYMALALASACADGNTKLEILSALGTDYDTLCNFAGILYRNINIVNNVTDDYGEKKEQGEVKFTNSIWVDNDFSPNMSTMEELAKDFYCYSFATDFASEKGSNAIRNFVKEQTNGKIDQPFKFSPRTIFALVNTLYLKDVWNEYGNDLMMTNKAYEFKGATTKKEKFLQSYYILGKAYQGENFTSFYTRTENGYKIKFILPNEGVKVEDVFTAEKISEANAVSNYQGIDEEQRIEYYTRCLFPEFSAKFDNDLIKVLKESFGINDLFNPDTCDLSKISNVPAYADQVKHVAKLDVTKEGIEGAAVTIISNKATSPAPRPYEKVYQDFLIDRPFGFILTDVYGTTLFSGVIKNV